MDPFQELLQEALMHENNQIQSEGLFQYFQMMQSFQQRYANDQTLNKTPYLGCDFDCVVFQDASTEEVKRLFP